MNLFLRKLFYNVPGLASLYHWLWAFLGAVFYRFPSKKIFVIGVTGTKGKTTVLELMNAIFRESGKKTALLSSIKVKIGEHEEENPTENTMPGRFFIQRFLSRAVKARCQYALIEITSEGVKSHRHKFINWNAAFIINIHPEHIEAHGDFERYRGAKLNFLKYAATKSAKIFVNKDDRNYDFLSQSLLGAKITAYSKGDLPDSYFGTEVLPMQSASGARAGETNFFLSDFNRENIAAAVVLAKHLGIADDIIKRAVKNFKGVSGRMEFIQKEPFAVVVDYAHTPDSLKAVYENLKPANSRLICVLGSAGGGRDKWKRPEMGRIAASFCDAIFLTNEDPYDEDPGAIINEIESGVRVNPRFNSDLSALTRRVIDRKEAIAEAIATAQSGDIIVITGKGSESWIHIANGKKIPWSDKKTAEEILGK